MLMVEGGAQAPPRASARRVTSFFSMVLANVPSICAIRPLALASALVEDSPSLSGLGPGSGVGFGRGPASGHAKELYGSSPFDNVAERLSEDVCTLGFCAGIGDPEDLPFPQVVQPGHVDARCTGQVSKVGFLPVFMIW